MELGLNLPSNVTPITDVFNPNKPETYHRTTSLTVYGASGSQHLATVYYVKTQAATSENPLNKWQTYVYIDGEQVDPALIQASDTGGDQYFVNKYGEIKTKSELEYLQKTAQNSSEYLVTQGTVYRKFSYDMLSDPIKSTPASLSLAASTPEDVAALSLAGGSNGLDLSKLNGQNVTRADLRNLLQISVDGSDFINIGLEHLVGKEGIDQLSGQELADELTKVIQERFGDGKKFDVSGYYNTSNGGTTTAATLGITRDLGEGNPDYLAVPVGKIIKAAVDANDIMATNGSMVAPEELAYALNKYFAGGYSNVSPQPVGSASGNNRSFADIKVAYDFERQALRITQTGDDSIHLTTDAAVTNELFGATNLSLDNPGNYGQRNTALASIQPIASADGDNAILLTPKMIPAGDLISETRNQRYGVEVNFSDGAFVFSSGMTGDGSSISIRNVASYVTSTTNNNDSTNFEVGTAYAASEIGERLFGLGVETGTPESENTVSVAEAISAVANRPAVRGQASMPAIVQGNQMGIDPQSRSR